MIDIHTHVLPGVDDGAIDVDMSQSMMERAADLGITDIVTTSHVYRPEDQARNLSKWPNAAARAHAIGLTLHTGCEFNYRALAKTGTRNLERFCLAETPCILLEFSNDSLMPSWEMTLCELAENGYSVIIAHPERYIYIQKDIGIAQEMLDYGCELQVDAGGLLSGIWNVEQKTAKRLLSSGMVSYIASDAHRPEHYATFAKAMKRFRDEWPTENRLESFLKSKRTRRRRNPFRKQQEEFGE